MFPYRFLWNKSNCISVQLVLQIWYIFVKFNLQNFQSNCKNDSSHFLWVLEKYVYCKLTILFVTNKITRMYTFIGFNSIQLVTVFTFYVFISSVRRHRDIIETITTTSPDYIYSFHYKTTWTIFRTFTNV